MSFGLYHRGLRIFLAVCPKFAEWSADNRGIDHNGYAVCALARVAGRPKHGDCEIMKVIKSTNWLRAVLCGIGLTTALGATGCQTQMGGQNLPSPYYLQDDVQFFPEGSEFILSREAAAMKQYKAEQQLQGR